MVRLGARGAALAACVAAGVSVALGTAYAKAPAGRYAVVAGGTLDTRTHLTWENPAPMSATWTDAKTYCHTLGDGWRLPTLKELQTLVDYSQPLGQVTPPPVDPIFADTESWQYWSATPLAGAPEYAWTIDFRYGETAKNQRTSALDVRCVK